MQNVNDSRAALEWTTNRAATTTPNSLLEMFGPTDTVLYKKRSASMISRCKASFINAKPEDSSENFLFFLRAEFLGWMTWLSVPLGSIYTKPLKVATCYISCCIILYPLVSISVQVRVCGLTKIKPCWWWSSTPILLSVSWSPIQDPMLHVWSSPPLLKKQPNMLWCDGCQISNTWLLIALGEAHWTCFSYFANVFSYVVFVFKCF